MKLEDGSPDIIEFYDLGQDDVLGTSTPRPSPEVITINRKAFRYIFHYAYGIICHLLSHVDWHLSLKPGTLASFCPQDKPSQTMLRMLRSPSQTIGCHRTKLIGHTDLGSKTILFEIVGGLQLLPAGSENIDANWTYIRPEPGCAVINLGDAMVQWSDGVLRSNVHRVATPSGLQAGFLRYSLAYLLRPEAGASMRRLGGGGVIPRLADGEGEDSLCAQDWEKMRMAQIVAGSSLPKSTGGQKL
ncbi:MAG: hypothetical protein ASARMPREDX12_000606 [Alectoria sarmentosa]|nr:MAG: hypothetical protein ASARMPREDX12_000606 [Alectoria sarmentosa]